MGLDTVELVVEVEKKFGITISNAEAATIVTVGDFHNVVCSKFDKANRSEIEKVMNIIIADKAGFGLIDITPERKICEDLGLD